MYKFKQDLAMAYFDGCSKKTASRLLAREITLAPGLLDALRPTGYRPAPKRLSPPPTPNPLLLPRRTIDQPTTINNTPKTTRARPPGLALN